ncbi:peptidoglycan-binding protein [Cerasibacillus terrae]|uniref:Peptidoglycan-binding protein n=1 Tax=Cerasibacillus terrae TaxID=2498845 RepID=A0A5C8NZJ3_9BACI|nr:peptidoglycan-binding domain-containing protein [Cerasibacillus terrae]TXL66720.1 peptidoglycan-binding protein [Cerasibacillus terrae]
MFKKIVPFLFYPIVIILFLVVMSHFKHMDVLSNSEAAEIDRFLMVENRLNNSANTHEMKDKSLQQTASQTTSDLPNVHVNDNGKYVRYLQTLLNIPEDGVYGQETYDKVVEFQLTNELDPDGVVDQQTWNKLQKES